MPNPHTRLGAALAALVWAACVPGSGEAPGGTQQAPGDVVTAPLPPTPSDGSVAASPDGAADAAPPEADALAQAGSSADVDDRGLPPTHDDGLTCRSGLAPFLCGGACPPSDGCCVTGVRPLGRCATMEGCADQCAFDCGLILLLGGTPEQVMRCEALCRFVDASLDCDPQGA